MEGEHSKKEEAQINRYADREIGKWFVILMKREDSGKEEVQIHR